MISRNQICQLKMCRLHSHIFCGPEQHYLHDAPGVSASVCTCVLVLCISVTLPAVEGICRFSGPVWAGSHQWQCRSSAEPIGKLRRSAGIVRLAWDVWAPCRRQHGCYSIPSRSRIHLAVKKKHKNIKNQYPRLIVYIYVWFSVFQYRRVPKSKVRSRWDEVLPC